MIFHRKSDAEPILDGWFFKCVLIVPVLSIAFVLYGLANSFNPDSRFCDYQIYKQADGTYQVWWSCRSKHIEGTFTNFAEAKAFQIEKCKRLLEILSENPGGERVK